MSLSANQTADDIIGKGMTRNGVELMSSAIQDPTLLAQLAGHLLVPVVVIDDARTADALGDALTAGGLPVAEVTFRTPAAGEAIRRLAARGDVLVGAGTVLTAAQVDQAVAAGARFIVSPGLSRAVLERCREHGVLPLPGAVTATEVQAALELGLTTVKFFPAESSGGAAAIRALAAPFPELGFMPTGGIGPDNLKDYLAVPSVRAVGGSWMVPRTSLGNTAAVTELVRGAVHLAATLAR
jgi:2-dehydro-3-deoxyphosphogluconate aldolase/(4S)-4-hydroxy-2-oxoglutarate aldolase